MRKLNITALMVGLIMMGSAYAVVPDASVRLKTNQQMVDVTLAANPTTGYQWYVVQYNHDLLSLQNYRYVAGAAGKGDVAIFTFSVDPRFYDAPQKTDVTFVYEQPSRPGVNATMADVAISATASSNDYSNWQKYPQLAGPAAEVQASEADISSQAQTSVAAPSAMVALPAAGAVASAQPSAPVVAKPAVAGTIPSVPLTKPSVAPQAAPASDSNAQWLSLPATATPASTSST
jgi:inhibitor of cysteine peptidase